MKIQSFYEYYHEDFDPEEYSDGPAPTYYVNVPFVEIPFLKKLDDERYEKFVTYANQAAREQAGVEFVKGKGFVTKSGRVVPDVVGSKEYPIIDDEYLWVPCECTEINEPDVNYMGVDVEFTELADETFNKLHDIIYNYNDFTTAEKNQLWKDIENLPLEEFEVIENED